MSPGFGQLPQHALRVLAASVLLLTATPANAFGAPTTCFPHGSETILESSTARVFATSRSASGNLRVFGCLYGLDRPFILVRDSEVEFGSEINNIRVAGAYVGFGFLLDEAEFGSTAHVRVVDLRTGHREHDSVATSKFFGDVFDVELAPTGAVAWIARAYDDTEGEPVPAGCKPKTRFRCEYPYEVRKIDHDRPVLLDRGHAIAPNSLTLGRGTVDWLDDGVVRTASMDGALPLTGFPAGTVALAGLLLLVAGMSLRGQTRRGPLPFLPLEDRADTDKSRGLRISRAGGYGTSSATDDGAAPRSSSLT